jgi:hypothetical protein
MTQASWDGVPQCRRLLVHCSVVGLMFCQANYKTESNANNANEYAVQTTRMHKAIFRALDVALGSWQMATCNCIITLITLRGSDDIVRLINKTLYRVKHYNSQF